jgi:hypothetical protein
LCSGLVLAEGSRLLLDAQMTPEEFVQTLVTAQQYQDAVGVLARALPVREQIWWACHSARQSPDFGSAPAIDAAVLAAEAWVNDASESNRYKAFDAAQLVRPGAAANCAAMAAFVSGRSMAPAREKPFPPPPGLSAQLTAGAVIVASIAEGAEAAPQRYLFFLEQGRQLLESAVARGA